MAEQLSAETKAMFKGMTERRRAAGIRLKRVCFMADEAQVEAFNIVWESWIERWGKTQAVDHLILLICRAEARYRDGEAAKERKNA